MYQCGIVDLGLSDHQMIYCTRKLVQNKTAVKKTFESRSLKNYSVDVYENALRDLNFPNYEEFTDIDLAYRDFTEKLTKVIDTIAPLKKSRIKSNNPEWFDREIAEKIAIRDKKFKKFKSSNLYMLNLYL